MQNNTVKENHKIGKNLSKKFYMKNKWDIMLKQNNTFFTFVSNVKNE